MSGEEADQEQSGTPDALRTPKGTFDVLAPESARWESLVATFATLAERHGFGLVLTPAIEDVRVFRRGIGETAEVVGKEMYELTDRGGRELALRPEGTAPVVRAYLQHRPAVPWRAWYATPLWRYERPQAGRYRQHHQVGAEVIGTDDPDVDVEVIALAHDFYGALGLRDVTLLLNSLGDPTCRPAYLELLRAHLAAHESELCDEHRTSWQKNPLRVLDCKTPACRKATAQAPVLAEHLCEPCAAHLARVEEGLAAAGIAVTREDRLVRGLDYYTRTTFEFASGALDAASNALGGGGRYDGLAAALGGPATPGVGFGVGIERVLLACDAEGTYAAPVHHPDVYVVDTTGGAAARDLVLTLRRQGIRAERAYDDRSMKAQLRAAGHSGARLAFIVGPRELAGSEVVVRDLVEGHESTVALDAALVLAAELTGRP